MLPPFRFDCFTQQRSVTNPWFCIWYWFRHTCIDKFLTIEMWMKWVTVLLRVQQFIFSTTMGNLFRNLHSIFKLHHNQFDFKAKFVSYPFSKKLLLLLSYIGARATYYVVVCAQHLNIYDVTDIQMLRANDLRSTLHVRQCKTKWGQPF